MGVVDGQFTGFITKKGKNFIYTSTERTGPGFSAFKASADRPAQRTRPLTSYPVSQSRVLPTNHEAGHVFSPTRKVGRAFFRTPVYCDYSPCFTDPTLSVVGFLWTVKLPVRHHTRNANTVLPTKPRSWSRVFIDQEGRNCVLHNLRLL